MFSISLTDAPKVSATAQVITISPKAYRAKKEFDMAIKSYKEALELDPKDSHTLQEIRKVYAQKKDCKRD